MEEIYSKGNSLVTEDEWARILSLLREEQTTADLETLKSEVKRLLLAAVQKRVPEKKFGLFLSGGVDSSTLALILKQLGADFTCYSVGFQDGGTKLANDITAAKEVAARLGLDLSYKVYDLIEAKTVIESTISILKSVGKVDTVSVGVGAVEVAAASLAKEDNIDFLFGGLGSEEIFAGYQRHENAADINEECWRGLFGMYERDLVRDTAIAGAVGFEIATPFLDEGLIRFAMQIPGEYKLKDGLKKWVLRQVALDLGLPKEFALRKKQGAQYGSGFDKAIAKLAGKQQKGEWLSTR